MSGKNIMEMTDEEIMGTLDFGDRPDNENTIVNDITEPTEESDGSDEGAEHNEVSQDNEVYQDDSSSGSPEGDDEGADSEGEDSVEGEDGSKDDEPDHKKTSSKKPSEASPEGEEDTDKTKQGNEKKEEVSPPNYEELYKQIMKPFKANGKEIKLDSPEEAIKLMQMGANYTKKMQGLAPNLKILRMLEKNDLINEDKLSHLIDLSKGDKNAIAKFIKDQNIDPMDIDTDKAINYRQGNHTVTDAEIQFQSIIEETTSTDEGQELIVHINSEWDQPSKNEIFKNPALIHILNQHKTDGVYDQISAEISKRKMLSDPQISSLPFLSAYELIGKQLSQQGALKPQLQNKTVDKPQQVIATGTAPKKPKVSNSEKVKAASPSAKSSGKAKQEFNPLTLSDEDFLKYYDGKI